MKKPKVDQTLYSLNVGNASRDVNQKLTPVKVTKVGRKYFYCENPSYGMDCCYHLDTWIEKTDTCANSELYESEQEWEDVKEAVKICKEISEAFEWGRNRKSLPLDKLREINKIIAE